MLAWRGLTVVVILEFFWGEDNVCNADSDLRAFCFQDDLAKLDGTAFHYMIFLILVA